MENNMTIDAHLVDALDKFADTLQNSVPSQNDQIDSMLLGLIQEPMKVIDGRDLALGFKYTLNVTNALQLRAKHWHLVAICELRQGMPYPCSTSFEFMDPNSQATWDYAWSSGATIGISTCSAICRTWSKTVKLWLTGGYALAVNQPAA